MNAFLSLLVVEDSEDDVLLVVNELRRSGRRVAFKRVEDAEGFARALEENRWDAVICDYVLPGFNALEALAIFRSSAVNVPFVVVSGTVGEDLAVEVMRQGADDYLMKDRLSRLAPSLERLLGNAERSRAQLATETALRESEQRFRLLAEKTRDLVNLTTPEGVIQYTSPSVRDLLGYAPEELAGRSFAELVHEDERNRIMEEFDKVAAGSHEVPPVEYRLRRKDGVTVWFETLMEPLTEEDGRISGSLCSSRDVSERHEIEQRFRQVQKMESLGNLAGGIAHDFNNILAVINGYSELIINLPQADEQMKRFAREINRSGERASQLVRQILTFARKAETHFHAVKLNHTIRDLGELLKETFPRSIDIDFQLDESIPFVQADAQQVSQVLMNLAVNARDVMKETGGRLGFQTEMVSASSLPNEFPVSRQTDYVCVRVTDTGFGMDEEIVSRIFEPFFTTKDVGEGTGLGLAVVYGIMQNHAGHVEVNSRPGKGSVFTLYFPTAVPTAPESASSRFYEPAGGEETLLLVEDEPMVAEWLRWSLAKKGYEVLLATNAAEAMRVFEKEGARIALILADHGLPGMSGWELFEKLKERGAIQPFVIATGYLDSGLRKGMLESGVASFLHKPFKRKDLLHHIRHVLDARASSVGE